jgi:RNA polymerase sigma factor (TIGR02999 family)
VNEAYLRLVEEKRVHWQGKGHFFGVSAKLMRRILVDHARSHLAEKRGSGIAKVALTEAIAMSKEQPADLLALDESLTKLAELDAQQSRIVELRIFTGLTVEETAQLLNISPATVKRDWAVAKAWLLRGAHGGAAVNPEKWERIKTIFPSALEREPGEREEFIVQACGGDDALRAELESLLSSYASEKSSVGGVPAVAVGAEDLAGQKIGPYKAIRQIGVGGMGAVYLAVRADDT